MWGWSGTVPSHSGRVSSHTSSKSGLKDGKSSWAVERQYSDFEVSLVSMAMEEMALNNARKQQAPIREKEWDIDPKMMQNIMFAFEGLDADVDCVVLGPDGKRVTGNGKPIEGADKDIKNQFVFAKVSDVRSSIASAGIKVDEYSNELELTLEDSDIVFEKRPEVVIDEQLSKDFEIDNDNACVGSMSSGGLVWYMEKPVVVKSVLANWKSIKDNALLQIGINSSKQLHEPGVFLGCKVEVENEDVSAIYVSDGVHSVRIPMYGSVGPVKVLQWAKEMRISESVMFGTDRPGLVEYAWEKIGMRPRYYDIGWMRNKLGLEACSVERYVWAKYGEYFGADPGIEIKLHKVARMREYGIDTLKHYPWVGQSRVRLKENLIVVAKNTHCDRHAMETFESVGCPFWRKARVKEVLSEIEVDRVVKPLEQVVVGKEILRDFPEPDVAGFVPYQMVCDYVYGHDVPVGIRRLNLTNGIAWLKANMHRIVEEEDFEKFFQTFPHLRCTEHKICFVDACKCRICGVYRPPLGNRGDWNGQWIVFLAHGRTIVMKFVDCKHQRNDATYTFPWANSISSYGNGLSGFLICDGLCAIDSRVKSWLPKIGCM